MGSNATIWRGPNSYALTIFAKQDGLLYYGIPGSIYSLFTPFFFLAYAAFSFANLLYAPGFSLIMQVISLAAIVLALIFAIINLSEVRRISAGVTDINNLIKNPFSKTVLICRVNQITDKKQCYLVNCAFVRVNPNGQQSPQRTGNIRAPKNYYGVEALMQEFAALQA